jgi:hypothetical protein
MKWISIVVVLLGGLAFCEWPGASGRADSDQEVPSIRADDIPKKAVIIGKLGIPLGTVATVRGRWVARRGKDYYLAFVVSHVDSKPIEGSPEFRGMENNTGSNLSRDPDFPKGDDKGAEGMEWEVRAWESGQFVGIPKSALDECRRGLDLEIPYQGGDFSFKFVTRLTYFKQRIAM